MIETLNSPSLLKVENLVMNFEIRSGIFSGISGYVHAVEDISFELKKSQTISLVGESGCGKTTTGRSILRLEEPTSGNIYLNGKNLVEMEGEELRKLRSDMQMIFQDPFSSLNPRMTIGEAVAEPMLIHNLYRGKELEEKVADLLIRVGISPTNTSRYPHEFSGGQRQRICIARALGPQPALIIADESVSALDVTIQAQIINLMMDLQDEFGISFLFISHDMAVVERISHFVAVMYLGRIVEIGSRKQIFENPSHPYTQKLLNAVPVANPKKKRKKSNLSSEEVPSPIKPLGYEAPPVEMNEIDEGHFVSLN
jgi:peptide/nickel transport system ATP-binding protein